MAKKFNENLTSRDQTNVRCSDLCWGIHHTKILNASVCDFCYSELETVHLESRFFLNDNTTSSISHDTIPPVYIYNYYNYNYYL